MTHTSSPQIKQSHISIALIIAVGIFVGLISHATPYSLDDIGHYRLWFKDYCDGVTNSIPIKDFYNFFVQHLLEMNGRMANLCMPLTLVLFPKWLFSITTGAVAVWFLILCIKISSIRYADTFIISCLCLCFVFFFPWYDVAYVPSYTLNYLYPATLALAFIEMFCNDRKNDSGISPAEFIFALFTATWHEGFCASIGFGLLIYLLIKRRQTSHRQFYLAIAFGIGSLLPLTAPGIWMRSDSTISFGLPKLEFLLQLFPILLISINIIAHCLYLFLRHKKPIFTENRYFFITSCTLGSYILLSFIYTKIFDRVLWFPCTFSLIGLFNIINKSHINLPKTITRIGSTLSVIAIIYHLSTVLYYETIVARQQQEIIAEYQKTDNNYIYYDILKRTDIPMITLSRNVIIDQSYIWFTNSFSRYYGKFKIDRKYAFKSNFKSRPFSLSILPTALRGVSPIEYPTICHEFNLHNIGNNIVAIIDSTNNSIFAHDNRFELLFKFEDGTQQLVNCTAKRYTIDNNEYCYIYPNLKRCNKNKKIIEIKP